MKRKIYIIIIVLTFIVLSILDYGRKYPIEDDLDQIGTCILSYINRPTIIYDDIDIKETLDIDNKKYILFTLDNTIGFSEFIKGYNHKYKYYVASHGGSNLFGGRVYETNKGKYIVIYGKNQGIKYKSVTVTLDNKKYKFELPQKEYYIIHYSVPRKTKSPYLEDYIFE